LSPWFAGVALLSIVPAGPLSAQAPTQPEAPTVARPAPVRLLDRIEGPMVYVAVDARAAAGAGADTSPLQRLWSDPALQQLVGGGGAAAGMFEFLRGVVQRASGEVELALTGILPAGVAGASGKGLPLVVVRTQLATADAERMRALLADGRTATPLRTLEGQPTYALAQRPADDPDAMPIEAAVVGDDLLVANHRSGLEEVLATSADRTTLGADPRFLRLRAQLQPPPGALLLFADWRRFAPRLQALAGGDLRQFMLGWSGLGKADAVMAAVAAHKQDLQSTVLLSFPAGASIDGWLALVQPVAARALAADLPVGGLGGVVLAIDPKRLVDRVEGMRGFAQVLDGGCGRCGLELHRLVRHLGQRGTMQMLLVPGGDLEVQTAFAVQAQSRKAATDLFDEVRSNVTARQLGREVKRGLTELEIADRQAGGFGLHLAVADDFLVFAKDSAALDALQAERRAARRGRRDALGAALHAFGTGEVGGLVHFDPAALTGGVGAAAMGHTGVIEIATGGSDGAVVRLRLLSSR
jgi:hypothetical protein